MSYIGGPLPGQEEEEESENRDLIQSYKDRTIGKETIDRTISVVQKLQKDSPEWLKQGASTTGSLLRDTYMDVRTLEGKEWLNPADVVTAGAVRAVEGIGWLGQKAIAEPVEAIAHKGLGIDPRGAKFLGIATEIAVTAGGAPKAAKYVKSGAAVGDLTEFAFKTADPESIAGMVYRTGGGVAPVPKKLTKLPPSVADVQIARKFKGDTAFVSEISAKTSRMKDLINQTADRRGWTDLSKYKGGDNYITTPKGEKFRYMWKDGRYSWRSMTSEGKRALKRLTGEGADLKSIEPLFRKHFNRTQAKEAAALYVDTQRVVNSKIRSAITKYNKTVPKAEHLSLEHIFDVKFYDNIKKDVPAFSGRGANELGNITALNKVENMRTGALNRKIDTWDAFLDTIRKDKGFPDYDKVISQFIYEDVGNVVANFTQKDWDEFIGQFLTRQGDTAQEIIIEMARKRN
tara:strand:- start:68 stop:1444 length:1377 start_codon:yes stop_codon:yes gene_type:complete